jgi:BRCA1-associated protein
MTKSLALRNEHVKRTCEFGVQEDWQLRLKRTECELNVLKHQKDEEIRELKEQVRDLMFYLEAQGKVKSNRLGSSFYF